MYLHCLAFNGFWRSVMETYSQRQLSIRYKLTCRFQLAIKWEDAGIILHGDAIRLSQQPWDTFTRQLPNILVGRNRCKRHSIYRCVFHSCSYYPDSFHHTVQSIINMLSILLDNSILSHEQTTLVTRFSFM